MRLDSDSCFVGEETDGRDIVSGDNDNELASLPLLKSNHLVYQTNYDQFTGGNHYIRHLYDFAVKYMLHNNISKKNPELWNTIETSWLLFGTLPVFQTNFEVMSRHFFTRPDVQAWNKALANSEPFGIFRHRWGDAHHRVFTLAMFATKDQVYFTSGKR
eukprot:131925_1